MFSELITKIKASKKIAIFNHEHPDGDALGSSYALKLALLSLGKKAEVFLREGDEDSREYALLSGTERAELKIDECDLKIALDCADKKRLGVFEECFSGNTIAIDHHVTHEKFAESTLVVADAPATGEIVFDLIREAKIELTREIANNLYLAIVCDTGNFKYSSTTAKTLRVAAELIETGIDFAAISKKIFDTKSFEYLKAYKHGIEHLEIYADGKLALLAMTDEDFKASNIDEKHADGLTTLPVSVENVIVGVYIRQRGEGEFKVSLRSNTDFDVSKVAMKFGGGGHVKASGFTLKMPLADAKAMVVKELEGALAK